jgi:hypothetical protein
MLAFLYLTTTGRTVVQRDTKSRWTGQLALLMSFGLGGWILLAGALPIVRHPLGGGPNAHCGWSCPASYAASRRDGGMGLRDLPVTPAPFVFWLPPGLSVLLAVTFLYSTVQPNPQGKSSLNIRK